MKGAILYAAGIVISTLPVAICTLSYFPLWRERGAGALLSGFTLLLLFICFVPLCKAVRRLLASPAAHTLWFIAFALFFTLSRIADEMTVISFVGFVSNLLGAVAFKLSGVRIKKNENEA